MDTDRNLLFGVLALQADLLDAERYARACTLWSTQKTTPLADLLVQQGWLTPADRSDVEKLLDRKLKKHRGDAKVGLAEATTDQVRQSAARVADPDVRQSLAAATPPAPGHVLVATTAYECQARERYTLSRLHATGGIGRVWLAHDASLGRDVALKELRPEGAAQPGVWARFPREAQITGQPEHPGVVPVYELGRGPADQAPYYTMRFVHGRTLAEAARAFHERRGHGQVDPLVGLDELGRYGEAMQEYQNAQDTYEKEARANPADSYLLDNLAKTHNNKGASLEDMRKTEEAIREYRKAVEIEQRAIDANPAVGWYQNNQAYFSTNLGNTLQELGRLEEALHAFQQGEEALEKLVDTRPAELAVQPHGVGQGRGSTASPGGGRKAWLSGPVTPAVGSKGQSDMKLRHTTSPKSDRANAATWPGYSA